MLNSDELLTSEKLYGPQPARALRSGFRVVQVLGGSDTGSGFRAHCSGCRVKGFREGFRLQSLGFKFQG